MKINDIYVEMDQAKCLVFRSSAAPLTTSSCVASLLLFSAISLLRHKRHEAWRPLGRVLDLGYLG